MDNIEVFGEHRRYLTKDAKSERYLSMDLSHHDKDLGDRSD